MVIIHHNDLDGYGSAFLIREFYRELFPKEKIITIEMDYSRKIDFDSLDIEKDTAVFVVDFSLDIDSMQYLSSLTNNIVWIDHHVTAIEKLCDYNHILGIRRSGISATALCWLYTHWYNEVNNYTNEQLYDELKKKAPKWVLYVDDWDIWKHEYPESEALNISTSSILSFDLIGTLQDDSILQQYIDKGFSNIQFRDNWGKRFMSEYGFPIELDGYNVFCVNGGSLNSKYFGELIKEFDAVMNFCYNSYGNRKWKVSIYSEKIDVSEIAKHYGGGGHKGASGFYFDDINFILNRQKDAIN